MVHRFDPVGSCIYCGRISHKLNEEHIVPYGLGGKLILPESSCDRCSAITGKFEGVVQRTIYGDFRMRNRMPTRRKSERPKLRTINSIDQSGNIVPKDIPVDEFPAPLWIYNFGQCGILLGSQPDTDVTLSTMNTIHNHDELVAFADKHNWDKTTSTRFMPNDFMRMIAKIGYSYSVALMGLGSFKPIVIDAIIDPKANISYFVGMNETYEPMIKGGWHDLKIVTKGAPGRPTLLSVNVRLFSSAGTPTYHVIVGEFEHLAQEYATLHKLRERKDVEFADQKK